MTSFDLENYRIRDFRYVALIYCARSGSTYLARMLAEASSSICVIPEFRLPVLLAWHSESKIQAMSHNQLLALFMDDHQLNNVWEDYPKLPPVAKYLKGKSRREILDYFVSHYVCKTVKSTPDAVIIKNGQITNFASRFCEIVPEVRFLHIIRDPRAVVNSLVTSRDPYDGNRPMARGDVIFAADIWKRHMKNLNANIVGEHDVLSVHYEELMMNGNSTLSQILKWLDVPDSDNVMSGQSGSQGSAADAFSISPTEQALHRLANRKPDPTRINAWRDTMSTSVIQILERRLEPEIGDARYERIVNGDSQPGIWQWGRVWTRHYYCSLTHYGRVIARLAYWSLVDHRKMRARLRQFAWRIFPEIRRGSD